MRCPVKSLARWTIVAFTVLCYMVILVVWQIDVPKNQVVVSVQREGELPIARGPPSGLSLRERSPRNILDIGTDSDTVFKFEKTTLSDRRVPDATLDDLFISVKTTKIYHQTRLNVILKTWFALARDQTYFFSDSNDPVYSSKTRGHFINTNCSSSHSRKALCCKMSVEFDTFLESSKKWFCHFDDDNYVNVPRLLKLLQGYNPQKDWYLGKPSIRAPLGIISRDQHEKNVSFWFATGGAGFCISKALALKMSPLGSGGKFISIGEKIRLPDDVTMGYIVEHLLKKKLTVVEEFHSHFEPMKFLKQEFFADQISFSYSRFGKDMNALQIDGFNTKLDPTRFLSLHCYLFPNFSFCPS